MITLIAAKLKDLSPGRAKRARRSGAYRYSNLPSKRRISIELPAKRFSMEPSFSTGLLIKKLQVAPGSRVLDLCAGSGVVGIAASKLGAGSVVSAEVDGRCKREIIRNAAANEVFNLSAAIGDLFAPVEGKTFDHVVFNPPSTPAADIGTLPVCYRAGTDGRALLDRILHAMADVLAPGGVVTFVQSSLANPERSFQTLEALGYEVQVDGPHYVKLPKHTDMKQLEQLEAKGLAYIREVAGVKCECRYILTATLSKA